ncbi:hypothetical protein WB388_18065 [Streptomyces brasiliscabiei]|uniref:Uncharacterized protein n=1 Tax=Streptomyces brasiliscabiei TaxID=2736302 RepID=A0ABU8GH07_9ACTN
MKLYLIRTDPVHELAAHPDTLQLLIEMLQNQARAVPPALSDSSFFGWSLVADSSLRRDLIHLRPHPQPEPQAPE